MKTKYALMFRLSNRVVQVDFTDKTQIILCSETQMVHYRNKKGERTQHPLATALDSDYAEMVKRLKYTKEILTHIHNANQAKEEFKSDIHFNTLPNPKNGNNIIIFFNYLKIPMENNNLLKLMIEE